MKTLILDHVIMEFFREDPTELGCSIIYVADVLSSLSEISKLSPSGPQPRTIAFARRVLREGLTFQWITSLKTMTRSHLGLAPLVSTAQAQFRLGDLP